jgi:tRNA A37 threonylcarbamoyladenosine modification protein TsaB
MFLFINTTDPEKAELHLIDLAGHRKIVWSDKKLSQSIFLRLKQLLKNRPVAGLKKIAVTIGPGSFSRIRTGVAIANALACALEIPVVGIKQGRLPKKLSRIFTSRGAKMVLPVYSKQANISKPKKLI